MPTSSHWAIGLAIAPGLPPMIDRDEGGLNPKPSSYLEPTSSSRDVDMIIVKQITLVYAIIRHSHCTRF